MENYKKLFQSWNQTDLRSPLFHVSLHHCQPFVRLLHIIFLLPQHGGVMSANRLPMSKP